jgi:hypothetical protein
MNEFEKKKLAEEQNRASSDFGTGSLLMRPEDTSVQGASDDFMKYLQNPTADMMPPAPVGNPSAIEDFDAMIEQDALDKSMKAPPVAPVVPVAPKAPMVNSQASTPPASILPQEDILSQLKAARDANAASLASARQSDKMTELGNLIMKSGSMAGQGIVNQSGNTNIKLDAAQSTADESKFAGEGAKSKLEALMQDYGIKKGMDDTTYNRKKDAESRQDRLNERAENVKLKREEMDYKKLNDASAKIQAKEEVKEGIQINKENRKNRLTLDTAERSLAEQIKYLKETKRIFEKYSKGSNTGGTGPIANAFGFKEAFDKDLEEINSRFKKGSLDEMVKMFAGMSKAVDSEGERKAFETTQPSTRLDDPTNISLLNEKIAASERLLGKTKVAKSNFDRTGNFTQSEENVPTQNVPTASTSPSVGSIISSGGKRYKVINDSGDLEEVK